MTVTRIDASIIVAYDGTSHVILRDGAIVYEENRIVNVGKSYSGQVDEKLDGQETQKVVEPAPGIDHFRTPVEKGAELICDAIRGHTTGLAQPMYVVATRIGKIPLMPDYYIVDKTDDEYTLRNYEGKRMTLPNVPE